MKTRTVSVFFICLCMMFLYAVPTECHGQDVAFLKHITQRGETIGSMADMYDVEATMLKAINCDMDTFYTGLEVLIPVDKKYLGGRTEEDSEVVLSNLAGYFSGFNEGYACFRPWRLQEGWRDICLCDTDLRHTSPM